MLKRIDLHIEFPHLIIVDNIKIPKLYDAHIYSNTNEMNVKESYKQLVSFFSVYGQNVRDYDLYLRCKNGNIMKLEDPDIIGKLLISRSSMDICIQCIYSK